MTEFPSSTGTFPLDSTVNKVQFKNYTQKWLDRLAQGPLVLMVNTRRTAVLLSPAQYDELMKRVNG